MRRIATEEAFSVPEVYEANYLLHPDARTPCEL
jgi:hypothetical protein